MRPDVENGELCANCEEWLPDGAQYCQYCGERVLEDDDVDVDDQEDDVDEESSEYQQVHWSSESDEWATPPSLLRPLDEAVGGFDLDPCSGAEERSIAPETYTEEDDGLSKRWHGRVWLNHPYSESEDWLEKARFEAERDAVELVLVLAPARTSTDWFQKYATQATAVCFIDGRLRFGDADDDAPFPSMLLAFGDVSEELYETLRNQGVVYIDGRKYQPTRQIELGAVATDGGDRA